MRPLLLVSVLLTACLAPDSLVHAAHEAALVPDDDAFDELPPEGDGLVDGAVRDEDRPSGREPDPPPGADADADGVPDVDDCAPDDGTVHPGATERCGDGIDQDCAPGGCGLAGITRAGQAPVRLLGSWTGGGLGGSIATVDLDRDGARDLLVGAPCAPMASTCPGVVAAVPSWALVDGSHDVVAVADSLLESSTPGLFGATVTVIPGVTSTGVWIGMPLGPSADPPGGSLLRLQLPLPAGRPAPDDVGVRWLRGTEASMMPLAAAGLRLPTGDEILVVSEASWASGEGRLGFLWARRAVRDPVVLAEVPDDHVAPPATWWSWPGRAVEHVGAGRDVLAPSGADWVAVTRSLDDPLAWRVHVHGTVPQRSGGEGSDPALDATFDLPGPADEVRAQLAADLTGDGADDLVVGASCDGACAHGGTVWVVPGPLVAGVHDLGRVGLTLPGVRLDGLDAGARLGEALLGEADLDDDGAVDLVVGAPGADGERGAVVVLHGPLPHGAWQLGDVGGDLRGRVVVGEVPGDRFGAVLALGDDVDDDGVDELLVAAPRALGPAGVERGGRVYLFRGGAE